jgi:hypothetical protein
MLAVSSLFDLNGPYGSDGLRIEEDMPSGTEWRFRLAEDLGLYTDMVITKSGREQLGVMRG